MPVLVKMGFLPFITWCVMAKAAKTPRYFWPQDTVAARLLQRLHADEKWLENLSQEAQQQLTDCLHAHGLKLEAISVSHHELILAIKALAQQIPLHAACNAFVASISSAPAWWRDVLPACALAQAMPVHTYQAYSAHSSTCRQCFMPDETETYAPTELWTDHQNCWDYGTIFGPLHTWFVLQQALQTPLLHWPQPHTLDVWKLDEMFALLRDLPSKLRYSKVRVPLAKLFGINQSAASSLLEALADIGFLNVPEHPGLLESWSSAATRDARPSVRVEAGGPLAWWQSGMGLNESLIQQCFGHLTVPTSEPSLPERAPPVALPDWAQALLQPPKTSVSKVRYPHIPAEIAAGDVYAVPLENGLWVLLYCHGTWLLDTVKKPVTYAVVEFLNAVCTDFPEHGAWNGVGFQPRGNKRSHYRCAGLARYSKIRRIAQNVPLPQYTTAIDLQAACVFTKAADLAEMASWHFDLD